MTPQVRYQRKMARSGRCTICGALDTPGTRCGPCAQKMAVYRNARRALAKAEARCIDCGCDGTGGCVRCFDCRVVHAARTRANRGSEPILCRICGKPMSGRKATCPERCRSRWREARRIEAKLRRIDAEKRRGKWAA